MRDSLTRPASRAPLDADGSRALTDFPPALIEVALGRVVASNTFRRSQRHRAFLEHVVRVGLSGQRERLKEVIIGIEVFGRALPAYDPRRDPIVRVEAGRVREKLARFYENEGASESFGIVLPVGNYLPMLVQRKFDAKATARANTHALAVLPFVTLSADRNDLSFAIGLADQLIDTIGRAPGLRIVARISASKARDAGLDLKAIGKLLGVDHVVEGSLQRSGRRVRCIAQLSRTKDSVRVWSERFEYDEDHDDLFDYQDAIANAVLAAVATLGAPPGREARTPPSLSDLVPAATGSREARDLYERGRYLAQQRTHDGYTKAITALERAIELDPSYARAYSQLGSAYANRTGFNLEPAFPAFAHTERAARKALELDPLDGEARALLAVVAYRVQYRWSEAEPMFQDALRLAPNSTLVHSSFAWALVFNGHPDEAMRHARLAQELDPLNLGLRANNAAIAMYARLDDLATREFRAVLEIEPDHVFSRTVLGITLLITGDFDAARTHFLHVARLDPTHATPRFCLVCVQGLEGAVDDARRDLATLTAGLERRHYSRINLAMAQNCTGDIDGAFASVTYAAAARDALFVTVTTHALFAPMRADPRFPGLLNRYGLTPPISRA